MKKMIFVAVALLAAAIQAGADETETREVVVTINDAYVPSGFDSTSDVFVVESGFLPGCYTWQRADVTHPSANLHEVRTIATVRGGLCPRIIIPYTKESIS